MIHPWIWNAYIHTCLRVRFLTDLLFLKFQPLKKKRFTLICFSLFGWRGFNRHCTSAVEIILILQIIKNCIWTHNMSLTYNRTRQRRASSLPGKRVSWSLAAALGSKRFAKEKPPFRFSSHSVPLYNQRVKAPNWFEALFFSFSPSCPFYGTMPFYFCISEQSVLVFHFSLPDKEERSYAPIFCQKSTHAASKFDQPQLGHLKTWLFFCLKNASSLLCLFFGRLKVNRIFTLRRQINDVGRSLAFCCSKYPN